MAMHTLKVVAVEEELAGGDDNGDDGDDDDNDDAGGGMAAVEGEFPGEKAAPADGNHVSSLPRHRLTAQ